MLLLALRLLAGEPLPPRTVMQYRNTVCHRRQRVPSWDTPCAVHEDQGFESGSLQRVVCCEPHFRGHSIGEPKVGIQPRDLVVLKASVVDAELEKLDLKLRTVQRATRMVSPTTYEVGETAGASLAMNPGNSET